MPLTSTPLVSQTLKSETRDAHHQAEQLLAPHLASINSFDDYARILKAFYGFFHPLEMRIATHVNSAVLTDAGERRNSLLILQDLKSIHHSTENIPVCHRLPLLQSVPQALGAMYVLEGSTLGGRMICKMLLQNRNCTIYPNQLGFFAGYGGQTGSKWTSFLSVLNTYDDAADEIVFTANTTFNALTAWMHQIL